MGTDVFEICDRQGQGTGRYRRMVVVAQGARPRPLCDCDGGHASRADAAACPIARQAAEHLAGSPILQSVLAGATPKGNVPGKLPGT